MAPFSEAVAVTFAGAADGVSTYKGAVDPMWTVFSVPNGGYTLGIVVEACVHYQSQTVHKDPIHVTAHFLKAVAIGPVAVRIRTLKTGRGFSNLTAELVQGDSVRILAHIICGDLRTPSPDTHIPGASLPPSFQKHFPFSTHPARGTPEPQSVRWSFASAATRGLLPSDDALLVNRRRVQRGAEGAGGIESGVWMQLHGARDAITPSAVTLFADLFEPMPITLAEMEAEERGGKFVMGSAWAPTLVMTIEFKAPFPTGSATSIFAPRTVAIYSRGTIISEPQGRHDEYVEVWTAPASIGEPSGVEDENWRDKQVCLAISTQMALVVSGDLNRKLGGASQGSAKL